MSRFYTIGHSTRSIDEFIGLLKESRIERLVDVRRYPASRRHPHFAREALAGSLETEGIAYEHEEDLGGRRRARPESPNRAWRSAGFRGYADHMASPGFAAALERVIEGAGRRSVLLCAEAVPWRCHRQLIADALVARGHEVIHILGRGDTRPHELNPAARRVPEGHLVYPEPPPGQGSLDL